MVKFNVSDRETVSIGFTVRDIQIIDSLLEQSRIKEIGINSRAKLFVCITHAISKRFAQLSEAFRQTSDENLTEPQGIILTNHQEMKDIAQKISKSKAGQLLTLTSSQDMVMYVVHHLMRQVRPNHQALYKLLEITLTDLEEAFCEKYRSSSIND